MEQKLLKIINHYGVLPQLKYFQSEVFELNEAIILYEENKNGTFKSYDLNHITEEIADVMVMLKQFQRYYKINREEVRKIMNEKIDRQLGRIEKEVKDE